MRKQLESPIGNLQHTCTIILPGRTFLRRMINLLSAFQRDDHPIGLNQELRLDLSRWREFFDSWYGLSFLLFPSGHHYLIFLFPQMQPEPWVTAHSFTLSGLWGNCLPLSCRYRQQAFPESSLVKALELELQLQLPSGAFSIISLRPRDAGQVKRNYCMCAHPWIASSQ